MQDLYKPYYKQVRDLQFKFHDVLDKPDHPTAHVIRNELKDLETDLETDRHPRDIEKRVHSIQNQIMQAQHSNTGLMSPLDTDHFHDHFEDMRMNIRKHPHY